MGGCEQCAVPSKASQVQLLADLERAQARVAELEGAQQAARGRDLSQVTGAVARSAIAVDTSKTRQRE